jgi:peptidyl-prolyl cis-trans isomerase SurA
MKPRHICALVVLVASAALTAGGEVIDRIVATVNGSVILQSDWETAVRFEAFVDGKELDAVTDADRKAALGRLIDQTLIDAVVRTTDFVPASDQAVAAQVLQVRKQLPSGATDASWRAALARYGLDDSDVMERVRAQMDDLRFVELRFRPSVKILPAEVEKYYREEFLPQLHRAGGQDKPLADVRPQIEELLIEARVNELEATWLQSLRTDAHIAIRPATAPVGQTVTTAGAPKVN